MEQFMSMSEVYARLKEITRVREVYCSEEHFTWRREIRGEAPVYTDKVDADTVVVVEWDESREKFSLRDKGYEKAAVDASGRLYVVTGKGIWIYEKCRALVTY